MRGVPQHQLSLVSFFCSFYFSVLLWWPASEQADLASSLEPLDAKTNMHVLRAKAAVRLEEVEIERACPRPIYAILVRNHFAHKDSSSHG